MNQRRNSYIVISTQTTLLSFSLARNSRKTQMTIISLFNSGIFRIQKICEFIQLRDILLTDRNLNNSLSKST